MLEIFKKLGEEKKNSEQDTAESCEKPEENKIEGITTQDSAERKRNDVIHDISP